MRPATTLLFAWLAALLLVIYGLDVGHGFVKDDFAWIAVSRLHTPADALRLFTHPAPGFYRPFVALTFGLDERLFGLAPGGYAVTNLAILAVTIAGLACLVRALGLTMGHGVAAAAIWALNFHGINMALLWISGRTALLLCAWSAFAALALVRRRALLAGVLALGAMLSKEEATMLPLIFGGWLLADARLGFGWKGADTPGSSSSWRDAAAAAVAGSWPTWLALAIYGALRVRTNALTPGTAPWFYQLSAAPGVVWPNLQEYADRSSTFAALVTIALLLAGARWPRLETREKRLVVNGAIWLAGGFALTIWLPVRSSLYACFPSMGSALIATGVIAAAWRGLPERRQSRLAVAALLLPVALIPVYRARNDRLSHEAALSARFLAFLTPAIRRDPRVTSVVLIDDPAERPSLDDAFGVHLGPALALHTGRTLDARIDNAAPASPADPRVLRVALQRGLPVRLD